MSSGNGPKMSWSQSNMVTCMTLSLIHVQQTTFSQALHSHLKIRHRDCQAEPWLWWMGSNHGTVKKNVSKEFCKSCQSTARIISASSLHSKFLPIIWGFFASPYFSGTNKYHFTSQVFQTASHTCIHTFKGIQSGIERGLIPTTSVHSAFTMFFTN